MEETLGEKTENVGIRNPATKKKVRVVKKIVKKKVIKKVPKRVPVPSNCNDLEKVGNPNPNVKTSMEIEKPSLDIDALKDAENVKELEVSGMEEDERQISGLVTSSLLGVGEQIQNRLQDSDLNQIELQYSDRNPIELQDTDQNLTELQDGDQNRTGLQNNDQDRSALLDSSQIRIELQDSDQNLTELQDSDQNQIGLQNNDQDRSALLDSSQNLIELQNSNQNLTELQDSDQNRIRLQNNDQDRSALLDGSQNRTELQDSNRNLIELHDSDQNQIGLQNNDQDRSPLLDSSRTELHNSDQNQIELLDKEHDTNTMSVEEHEGEEGVEELINSETAGLKSQEAFSESKVPSEKMVATKLHMKQMKKIFIHGLVQETKEEDIRKVFEEVGEVVEVKLITNLKTGKSRGFGFITFASADLANLALTKYQNVEICGRPCHTAAIEGIDTILLNNINKKWNKEHVVELLQKIGIKKIDGVLVVPDPDNAELNCGFAFLEFETKRDAQMAYHKLQNENASGKHSNLKVSWASSFVDPVEEEIPNIKSVYAENIPLSWDEKEVNDHFKMFGEIESIALAKNLRTAKRNDFAFINYKTREAALSCIAALTCKKSTSNHGPKGHLKVSLAKSIPKVKPNKAISDSAATEVSQAYHNVNRSRKSQNQHQNAYQSRQSQHNLSFLGVYKPPQKPKVMIGKHEDSRKDSASSTTAELVQLLREQASWKQGGLSSTTGHHQPPFGGKQPYTELGSKSLYHHDPRAYHQPHFQIPNVTHHRPMENVTSFPRHDQQRAHYTSGSFDSAKPDPRALQIRDSTTYPGSSSVYRQML